jgi:glycerol-3-phosphate acyltransferase PlsX
LTIAVDLMGGDLGPRSTLPASLVFAGSFPELNLTLFGDEQQLQLPDLPANVTFVHSPDTVAMDDKPALALRQKQQSSMWQAIETVADERASACVSAGNTGALMAMGKFMLKTYPGIDRPAICKAVPCRGGHCYMLDLGANLDCTSEQLEQFALMGSILAESDGIRHPVVGLLNVGSEHIKGHEQIRLAANSLTANPRIRYGGFVEGDGIFSGEFDVVVTDGFAGNVALKVGEGAARLLGEQLQEQLQSHWLGRLAGQIASPLLRKWHTKFDPARYNGASFLGLQGIVVKSHGSADERGFGHALQVAREQAIHGVPQKINQQIAELV